MVDIFILENPLVALAPLEVNIGSEYNLKNFPSYLVNSNKVKPISISKLVIVYHNWYLWRNASQIGLEYSHSNNR